MREALEPLATATDKLLADMRERAIMRGDYDTEDGRKIAILDCGNGVLFGLDSALEAARAALAERPAQGEAVAWHKFPDELPPPDTECLVELPFLGGTYRAVDRWELQHEAPLEWSSATVAIGMGWSDYGDDVLRWIPIDKITAPPAPAVSDGPLNRPISGSIAPGFQAPPAPAVPDDVAYIAGALAMREKIARCIAMNPRRAIYEIAEHIRENIGPPSAEQAKQWDGDARAMLASESEVPRV